MCECDRIEKRIACPKCGYPPSEARYDLGPKEDNSCACKSCPKLNAVKEER